GGDVIEGLVAAPRQHARERVHSLENVLLQVLAGGGALDLGVLLRTPHGQREPGLVVVVVIPRQRREVAQSHAAQRGPQLALAGLGWATAYGVHLAVHVVGLPPVVPAVKSLVPSQGWPGYHCKIGPRHAPYFRGVAVRDCLLGQIGPVIPKFVHAFKSAQSVRYSRGFAALPGL